MIELGIGILVLLVLALLLMDHWDSVMRGRKRRGE